MAYQAIGDGVKPLLTVAYKAMGWTTGLDACP
jgi:hypothetical protein